MMEGFKSVSMGGSFNYPGFGEDHLYSLSSMVSFRLIIQEKVDGGRRRRNHLLECVSTPAVLIATKNGERYPSVKSRHCCYLDDHAQPSRHQNNQHAGEAEAKGKVEGRADCRDTGKARDLPFGHTHRHSQ